jgi:hypothetical protein
MSKAETNIHIVNMRKQYTCIHAYILVHTYITPHCKEVGKSGVIRVLAVVLWVLFSALYGFNVLVDAPDREYCQCFPSKAPPKQVRSVLYL